MQYREPVTDLIRRRRSWRSYSDEAVSADQMGQISSFIESLDPPPFGTRLRFSLVEAHLPEKKHMPGTYGVVKGARNILVGALKPSPMDFEDFGYSFEAIILFCTQLGLGTCWMGGTFNRSLFGRKIDLGPDEVIPAVSPVGKPLAARSVLDSLFALSAGSKDRKAFSERFFINSLLSPLNEEQAGRYREALEMVRLAPSATNRQPWRVVLKDGSHHFFLARTTGYSRIFSGVDLQRVDMGIAMFHFEAAARQLNLPGKWQKLDESHGIFCPRGVEYRASWVV